MKCLVFMRYAFWDGPSCCIIHQLPVRAARRGLDTPRRPPFILIALLLLFYVCDAPVCFYHEGILFPPESKWMLGFSS